MTDVKMTELAPDVYAIDAPFEDVSLLVYLIAADEVTIIDPGVATTPAEFLLPALAQLGISPGDVSLVINTHGHHDHRGGNAVMLDHNPKLEIAAHSGDAGWIEDVEAYIQGSYGTLAPYWEPSAEFLDRVRRLCGRDTQVNRRLADGDELILGPRHSLCVHHVPAHTPGHVVLHHEQANILLTGDAMQGSGTPLGRRPTFFPFYTSVAEFERSLTLVESLAPDLVGTAHHGVCDKSATAEMVADSRRIMRDVDSVLLDRAGNDATISMSAALEAMQQAWPGYGFGAQLIKTARAHLDALTASEQVSVTADTGR